MSSNTRFDFPLLTKSKLAYLDNAATTQKPQAVIDAIVDYYTTSNANVHRGVYELSETSTLRFNQARSKIAGFLGAKPEETIFTSGTTHGINLVANCLASKLKSGDEIIVGISEHHSNLVPWQFLQDRLGVVLKFIPLDADYQLDMAAYQQLLSSKTKVVACAHISNVLGQINPIQKIVSLAQSVGAYTVIDGAQGAPHVEIDVKKLGCDFYAVSAHKMYGPTGIGALYGREEILEELPPYMGGGDMITEVSLESAKWNVLPNKFEAGTPNMAGVIGFGAAVDYLSSLDRKEHLAKEQQFGQGVVSALREIKGSRVFATPNDNWVGEIGRAHV